LLRPPPPSYARGCLHSVYMGRAACQAGASRARGAGPSCAPWTPTLPLLTYDLAPEQDDSGSEDIPDGHPRLPPRLARGRWSGALIVARAGRALPKRRLSVLCSRAFPRRNPTTDGCPLHR
jgi:hypothetical protein